MTVIDFLRDVGKNFRLGTMLAKDTVARRLNSEEGISFTEFSYQVLQGNDFLHLFDEYHCTLELGGSDQWGNLTSGLDLIHKVRGVDVNVFTSPIITDASGKKFGKSEGNASGSTHDAQPVQVLPVLDQPPGRGDGKPAEGVHLPAQGRNRTTGRGIQDQPRQARGQKTLAWRSPASCMARPLPRLPSTLPVRCSAAVATSKTSTRKRWNPCSTVSRWSTRTASHVFPVSKPGDRVIDAAQAAGLFKSASEARRAIKSGGVYLNNNRIEDEEQVLAEADFLAGRFALIRRGKKRSAPWKTVNQQRIKENK